jgi:hypothetical protein
MAIVFHTERDIELEVGEVRGRFIQEGYQDRTNLKGQVFLMRRGYPTIIIHYLNRDDGTIQIDIGLERKKEGQETIDSVVDKFRPRWYEVMKIIEKYYGNGVYERNYDFHGVQRGEVSERFI